MSPYGYIQLFVFGLLCSGAISEENITCRNLRAQSNVDLNQLYGDWFLGQLNIPANATIQKSQCFSVNVQKINETIFEVSIIDSGETVREVFSIENSENAGTWHVVDSDRSLKVIYLYADGTTIAMASCLSTRVEPFCVLMGKQLPIRSEQTEEVLHAMELAGISGSHCHFTWKSEATCPSA